MYKESESKKGGRDEVTADRGLPRIWASSWCTVLSVSPFAIRPLVYKFAEWRAIRADCALFGFPLSLSPLPTVSAPGYDVPRPLTRDSKVSLYWVTA